MYLQTKHLIFWAIAVCTSLLLVRFIFLSQYLGRLEKNISIALKGEDEPKLEDAPALRGATVVKKMRQVNLGYVVPLHNPPKDWPYHRWNETE